MYASTKHLFYDLVCIIIFLNIREINNNSKATPEIETNALCKELKVINLVFPLTCFLQSENEVFFSVIKRS